MVIKIDVGCDKSVAHGPFPLPLIQLIGSMSGKKAWPDGHAVFESSYSNLRILLDSDFKFEWNDPEGVLARLDEFRKRPTQKSAHAFDMDYEPAIELMKHQIDTLSVSRNRKTYAHLHEMGLGKTAIMIAEAAMLYKQGLVSGVFILAPKGVHRQWIIEQIPEHLNKDIVYSATIWPSTKPSRLDANLSFLSMNTDAIRTDRGFKFAKSFMETHRGKSMMVIDESHLIKNHSAARTRAAWELGAMATYRRIATGTPMSKNIIDAWSQFKFLDPNILGHKYVTSFRARYCVMGGFEGKQIIGQKNTEEFHTLIAPHSFRLTKAEALDLPPKLYVTREYEMSDVTRRHYRSMKELFLTELKNGDIVDVPNAAVCLLRLQQIICGYLPVEDRIEVISNERLHALIDIIEQVEGPVVIWARFIEDIHRITDALYPYGNAEQYYGATSTKDREIAKERFLSGKSRFFISNPAAGGTGLNLQGACQNVIYYSNSFDALHRWQSEDRTHRLGTTKPITYFDLVAQASVDRAILRNLKVKKSLSGLTLDEIRAAIAETE